MRKKNSLFPRSAWEHTGSDAPRRWIASWLDCAATLGRRASGRCVPTRSVETRMLAALLCLSLCACATNTFAGESVPPNADRAVREIYVPFSDLHVLLEKQPKRVLLGRVEYDELVKKAKKTPETHAPIAAAIVSADYAATAGRQRAEIHGTLAIDVLEAGLHTLPLDIGNVGLQNASLDDRAASIGRDSVGRLVLFVEGIGQHRLTFDAVAPLETTAARQVLNFRLPRPPAAKLRLTVAGDVEIKGGADVMSRTVDAEPKQTRFDLLPRMGDNSILMTLNSHLKRQDRAVVARSVLIDEVTEAYEALHATVSLDVLYRAVDQFQFVVPEGFEIIEVTCPQLARWDVQTEKTRKVLGVKLREQTTETVVLKIAAIRTPPILDSWKAPRLEALDVVGSVTVFGLLVEDRLKAESLVPAGLIPIDTTVLGNVLPATVSESALRVQAAWYAPQADFSLAAKFQKPPAEMATTTSLLLVIADRGHEVLGGLSFLPLVEKRFSFDVSVPNGWQIDRVTTAAGQPLPFERYDNLSETPNSRGPTARGAALSRVRVTVAGGMPVGQEFKVNFHATSNPASWTGQWASMQITFPKFAVVGATRDEGAVAIDVRDDFDVRPDRIEKLAPLDAAEKPKYGLSGVETQMAYRYTDPSYAATLSIERSRPRLTARTFSFLRIEPDAVACRYELTYAIEGARARQLSFLLPKDTPDAVSIAALDGVKIKDPTSEIAGPARRWNVSLVEPARGRVRLTVDFQMPLASREPVGLALPIVRADAVAYQSGMAAVEGCAELEVKVATTARSVDVGELAEAEYQPGRRLLGAFGFAGELPSVKIDLRRHPGYAIFPAIVERCELDTNVSPEGRSQSRARFKLRTKSLYLQVKLPAGAEFWSAELNDTPLKPQREGENVLIDVPASPSDAAETLQIVYAAPSEALEMRGTVRVPAPKLFLRAEKDAAAVEVPLADLVWRLHLPSGYEVVDSSGTVTTDELVRPRPAALQVAGMLYGMTGGVENAPFWARSIFRGGHPMRIAPPRDAACENASASFAVKSSPPPSACPAPREGEPALTSIGRITGMVDCQWTDTDYAPMHDRVMLGQKYVLASGLMELTYYSGAKVILQGPCTYEVDSNSGGYLSLGKLTARVEKHGPSPSSPGIPVSSPLFTIRTPTAVSSNLGGEAGVEVDKSGTTKVQVFRGSAALQESGGHGRVASAVMLRENESASVSNSGGQPVVSRTQAKPQAAFMRQIPNRQKMSRVAELDRIIRQRNAELEVKRQELNNLGARAGAREAEQRRTLEELSLYRQESAKIAFELSRVRDEQTKQTAIKQQAESRGDRAAADRAAAEIERRQADKAALEAQQQKIAGEVAKLRASEEKFGVVSVDAETLRAELKQLENTVAEISKERQLIRVGKANGFERALNNAEIAAIPFDDNSPVAYPDAKEWKNLTDQRKEKLGSMDIAKRGSAEQRIENALKQQTQLEFNETPLQDVVDYLKDMHKIEIQFDTRAMQDAGANMDAPVTKNIKDISLRSALRLMLRDLGLTYFVQDGVLLITTPEEAEKMAGIKVYPVADMVTPADQPAKAGETLPTPYYMNDEVEYHDTTVGMSSPSSFSGDRDVYFSKSGKDVAGARSLKIDVVQSASGGDENVVTFRSLGVEPELVVTLANRSRLSSLGWAIALLVALIGVAKTRQTVRKKAAFIVAVAVAATLVPLLFGGVEVARVSNMAFFAACLLIPYYLAAGLFRAMFALTRRECGAAAMILVAILGIGVLDTIVAKPQAAFAQNPQSGGAPYVIQVVEPAAAVDVPDDAVLLPYDPDWKNGVKDADRVLVPYDRYVELWNRVHPDKKIDAKAPPAPFALAGATYKTLLDGNEYLLVSGRLEIDVFGDNYVQIPLGLGGGVLAQATLDDKPARLSVPSAMPAPKPQASYDPFADPQIQQAQPQQPVQQAARQNQNENIPDRSMVVLHVIGKGRHTLDVSIRLKLTRQGGWRIVQGVLPTAPAGSVSITAPKAHTEIRLGQVFDRREYDTEISDQTIRTALGVDGSVQIAWRPAVAAGQIDRSLTAVSAASLDVQEDGLRLSWRVMLEFRRNQRERFNVNLPAGYLLEKVEGSNVRGWELRKTAAGQSVEVSLLQPAKDFEQFTLRLWRAGAVGRGELTKFDAPLVTVPDAALHTGQITLRRSPLVELRTADRRGVTRTDLPGSEATATGLFPADESPLGIRPFESYTFAAVPFAIQLAAAPVEARVTAAVQTVLKLSEFERSLESRVAFDVQGRPAYQLRMFLPDDFRIDFVSAPGEHQYAVTREQNRSLLTVYLAEGCQGTVPVLIRGRLGPDAATTTATTLPRLEALDVDGQKVSSQQGDIAVQADPAFDVETSGLKNCETVLLGQLASWLKPEQLKNTRLALHYGAGDYAGDLRLKPRRAEVSCDTITNIRLTDRALEETILLDFTIKNAGIREISFLLPADMAESRISVPMPRQKPTIAPVDPKRMDSPVRVKIELQDEVMGQLRVLVENDRLLTPGTHEAPVPVIEIGRMHRRYAAIENAGRDEVVVDRKLLREVEPLSSRQKDWEHLREVLGREMTMAYLVSTDAKNPRLAFHTESHAAVATVKASIGMAETTLAVDANGAYRAAETLRMDNATEQFLEIELPEGAELWTARVAGEPVKPTQTPSGEKSGAVSNPRRVRIPLIKTAPGELHYEVVLKYAGKMPPLGTVGKADFPLIRCVNIKPEASQVRLYVPEDHRWFDFGGTMRRVVEEADLQADYLRFETKQTVQLGLAMQQGDKYTKARASANLKAQQAKMQNYQSSLSSQASNPTLQSEWAANNQAMQQVAQEVEKQERAPAEAAEHSNYNRYRLNEAFQSQKLDKSKNVVQELGRNWDVAGPAPESTTAPRGDSSRQFNEKWLDQNKLADGDKSGDRNAREGKPGNVSGYALSGRTTTTTDKTREGLQGLYCPSRRSGMSVYGGQNPAQPQQPSAAQVVQNGPGNGWGYAFMGKTDAGRGRQLSSSSIPIAQGEERPDGLVIAGARRQGQAIHALGDSESFDRYKARVNQELAQQTAVNANAPAYDPRSKQNQTGGQFTLSHADTGLVPQAVSPSAKKKVPVVGDFSAAMQEEYYDEIAGPGPTPSAKPCVSPAGMGGMGGDLAPASPAGEPPAGGKPANDPCYTVCNPVWEAQTKGEPAYSICKPTYETRTKAAAGMASLDFDLPARGTLYRFTTPLGDQQITARFVSDELLDRAFDGCLALVVLLLLWIASGLIRRGRLHWLATPAASTVLICLGILSICSGVLPIAGIAAVLLGSGLKIQRWASMPTSISSTGVSTTPNDPGEMEKLLRQLNQTRNNG